MAAPDLRRRLPSLDALLRSAPARRAAAELGRPLLKRALRAALDDARAGAERGRPVPSAEEILARAAGAAAADFYGIADVINATGVILHTGLGRAPLPPAAARAAATAALGYSDLEVDRATGRRGRRTSRAEAMLCALTGAEDALVVNNNAAALLLALAGLAKGREVLVSRGELIEIGGEFRLPDVMAASGARLVEVGTTNRTRPEDYERAAGPRTALILKVHPSNYRVVGFTDAAGPADLAGIAHAAGLILLHDVGSGLLERVTGVPDEEPAVAESLAAGTDLVAFSGDKLLGGPQAGILAGRAAPIARLRRHPLARALRVDKMTVAALEAVLRLHLTGRRDELPVWRMLSADPADLLERAVVLASAFPGSRAEPDDAAPGGGSLPGHAIPSARLVVPLRAAGRVAARLRTGRPPVFCRTEEGALGFDLRTVPPGDDDRLARAIRYALAGVRA